MPSKSKNLYKDDSVILDLLSLMETDRNITQRNLARDLNIALGLVNLYVKKCIDKGLLKINQIPSKRYKYYITKKGFIEKARLTQEYFKTSFNFINKALDIRHMDMRTQLYIRSRAKVNVGNQSGALQLVVRDSEVYDVKRQFPIAGNIVKGEKYLVDNFKSKIEKLNFVSCF